MKPPPLIGREEIDIIAPAVACLAASLAAGTVQAKEVVVRIGHAGPLSGPAAAFGKDGENGARLAIEDANAKKLQIGGD